MDYGPVTNLGAIFLPSNPPENLRDIARAADDAGLEQLWLWEDCFLNSGIAAASAALASTSRLKVGIGIMPVPFRNTALTAMEVATLHRMFGDRPIVGFGHGVQDWMAQVGVKAASPMTLMREHLTALRALLRGEALRQARQREAGLAAGHPTRPVCRRDRQEDTAALRRAGRRHDSGRRHLA
jgi:alkanesulfonate monooxygenase SsuD/methylene tetrahydromethanopterin reductase-like flavin-dependent oxidoreductase (luciferase family)